MSFRVSSLLYFLPDQSKHEVLPGRPTSLLRQTPDRVRHSSSSVSDTPGLVDPRPPSRTGSPTITHVGSDPTVSRPFFHPHPSPPTDLFSGQGPPAPSVHTPG